MEITKLKISSGITFDFTNMFGKERITSEDLQEYEEKIKAAGDAVAKIRAEGFAKGHLSKDGTTEHVYFTKLPYVEEGNPNNPKSIAKLKEFGKKLWNNTDIVIFFGIGGSYLGNKVLFDLHAGEYWNMWTDEKRHGYPKVYFTGNNVDADQFEELLLEMEQQASAKVFNRRGPLKITLIPISKSGTTLELTSAFLYFYGKLAQDKDIFSLAVAVVTDLEKNGEGAPLHTLAEKYGWDMFDIPEGVGGRFSVLASPGLITGIVLGMDIDELLRGAKDMDEACQESSLKTNPALLNAAIKYIAGEKYGADMEVLMPYSMRLKSLSEWYVQLLAESLGKRKNRQGKEVCYGRTPIVAVGTTDMHAQTQQHQDGKRNKVIQFVEIEQKMFNIIVGNPFPEIKAYDRYKNMNVDVAQRTALAANAEALSSDNRFNANYKLPCMNPYYMGQLLYFLMLSIAYEGELADVDAFDQPGVETYKKIMNKNI